MSFADFGQPNETVYVQNLNERIPVRYLIPALEKLFGEYGEVLGVVAKKRLALRGQAFIIYKDIESSRKAVAALQGTRIYGKSMVVRFAKYKSDTISKADGTYSIERRRREQDKIERAKYPRLTRKQMMAQMAASGTLPAAGMAMPLMMPVASAAGLTPSIPMELPNKVLYLQHLSSTMPEAAKEKSLVDLFKQFPGFVEVRLVPTRPDVAFVEYENEVRATAARQATDETLIGDQRIRVSFARR